jgi:hypothetical protein
MPGRACDVRRASGDRTARPVVMRGREARPELDGSVPTPGARRASPDHRAQGSGPTEGLPTSGPWTGTAWTTKLGYSCTMRSWTALSGGRPRMHWRSCRARPSFRLRLRLGLPARFTELDVWWPCGCAALLLPHSPARIQGNNIGEASEPARFQLLGELRDHVEASRLSRLRERLRQRLLDDVLATIRGRRIAPRLPRDVSSTHVFGSTRSNDRARILACSRNLVRVVSLRNQVCPRGYQGFESPSLRREVWPRASLVT